MKIGCIQITSQLDPKENLRKISFFMEQASREGLTAVFLPEVFYSKSDGKNNTPYVVSYNNEHFQAISNMVKKYGVYTLGGSVVFDDNGIIKNRALNFSPDGGLIGYYDKINLFSCNIKTKEKHIVLKESNLYRPGMNLKMIEIEKMKLGLSICFDLRYPKLYQDYVDQGANVLSVSSAFTVPTGKAHWHTLLKARAIETQCYVVASAQWGKHDDKIESYGHSLIVDPWGTVLADAKDGEKLISAKVDLNYVNEVRRKVILRGS